MAVGTYTDGNLTLSLTVSGAPQITTGAGAPVSTPATEGDIYVDTTGDVVYIAAGTASSADWKTTSGLGNVVDDTTPQLGGDLDNNGKNQTDVQRLAFDTLPDTDHTATGNATDSIAAGTTIAAFELCYLGSGGKWLLTDANASATAGPVMLGLSLESKVDTQAMFVALPGSFVRDDTWAWTVGAELYISGTAGAMTETPPAVAGDIVRVVGYALSADVIYFNPSNDWITI